MSNSEQTSRSSDSANPEWTPCREGEIGSMVGRIRSRRKAVSTARITSVAAVLLAILAVSQFQSPQTAGIQPSKISCQETLEHQEAYQSGDLAGTETEDQIRAHLVDCPKCAEKYAARAPQARHSQPVETRTTARISDQRFIAAASQ